jgi:hypothetical protein
MTAQWACGIPTSAIVDPHSDGVFLDVLSAEVTRSFQSRKPKPTRRDGLGVQWPLSWVDEFCRDYENCNFPGHTDGGA